MDFLRFVQPDPIYKGRVSEVVVSVGQIVKIEPMWSEVGPDGDQYRVQVGIPDEEALLKGYQRAYRVYDSLGNCYASENASDDARTVIQSIWQKAK